MYVQQFPHLLLWLSNFDMYWGDFMHKICPTHHQCWVKFNSLCTMEVSLLLLSAWTAQQTFCRRKNILGPNFFKPSVPGDLRVFWAFASLVHQFHTCRSIPKSLDNLVQFSLFPFIGNCLFCSFLINICVQNFPHFLGLVNATSTVRHDLLTATHNKLKRAPTKTIISY